MLRFFESRKRSILKTLSWKLIATIISFSVVYFRTGNLTTAMEFSGIIFILGIIAYYLHERAWNTVHWEKRHEDQETEDEYEGA